MVLDMKVGDLVIMPGETRAKVSGKHSIGLVIADDYDKVAPNRVTGRKKSRIGIMWADGAGCVDYEPRSWLEVISG
jgi:hypothetical protein